MKRIIYGIALAVCVVVASILIIQNRPVNKQHKKKPIGPTEGLPENRAKDFSVLETSEVVKQLSESEDEMELRKTAKELGDRSISGTLELSIEDEKAIENVVVGYLKQAGATSSRDRGEAKQQIERLWHTAAPTLLSHLGSREPGVAELAIKSLILMRNESIIKALIELARTTEDDQAKGFAIFGLMKMQHQRKTFIPGRECLNEEESAILYERLVVPALDELAGDANS